ncbi:hypothetical protein [uncultured Winogradskyella sp.]|uniref:hypothetical protein n=1 Tax=uncultured Winogradskyella sp. TaxID=395353 RepID=UPI00260AD001|nr:hypothetical protein [uncultured Winogradskyella sp.]
MKFKSVTYNIFIFCFLISCGSKNDSINYGDSLSIVQFEKLKNKYLKKMKSNSINDSLDLIILLRASNTIRYNNISKMKKRDVKFIELYNEKYLLKTQREFEFSVSIDTCLYSNKIDMNILPCKLIKPNDVFKIIKQ